MKVVREWKVYLYEDGQVIDETCIDEKDEDFAWHLFKDEFGHTNLNDTAYIVFVPMGLYDTETGDDVEETPKNVALIGK